MAGDGAIFPGTPSALLIRTVREGPCPSHRPCRLCLRCSAHTACTPAPWHLPDGHVLAGLAGKRAGTTCFLDIQPPDADSGAQWLKAWHRKAPDSRVWLPIPGCRLRTVPVSLSDPAGTPWANTKLTLCFYSKNKLLLYKYPLFGYNFSSFKEAACDTDTPVSLSARKHFFDESPYYSPFLWQEQS